MASLTDHVDGVCEQATQMLGDPTVVTRAVIHVEANEKQAARVLWPIEH